MDNNNKPIDYAKYYLAMKFGNNYATSSSPPPPRGQSTSTRAACNVRNDALLVSGRMDDDDGDLKGASTANCMNV